ncbi:MAG: redoxin domain-containing protein [Acidobacteria bacterium]|nr:redoxin domain-containing protein [Acidobacteriota bacterium]
MLDRRQILLAGTSLLAATPPKTTILSDDHEIALNNTRVESTELWIQSKDLPAINGFEVKPQGACRGDVCIPLNKSLRNGSTINLTAFATKLQQAQVREGDLWSFGPISLLRASYLESRQAPDFSVKDRKGTQVQLKDFRGRKVLLLTWASW